MGDIDGDGRDDVYLSAGAGFNGMIGLGRTNGPSRPLSPPAFAAAKESEKLGALFFDSDGDGDLDLYVVSGGVVSGIEGEPLQDLLYINDGHGGFSQAPADQLPKEHDAGSVVCAADFDRDGDLDLFVGGRSVPGRHPLPARSHLYRNDKGRFVDITDTAASKIRSLGIVTSALWSDVNDDGWIDLLVCEEWGFVRCFLNSHGNLIEAPASYGFRERSGLWQSIVGADVDGDGDMDYIVGNLGMNSRYHATEGKPLRLYRGDFNDSGITNLLETLYEGEQPFPLRNRASLLNAFPALGELFPNFEAMANASLNELFPKLSAAAFQVEADTLTTGIWINEGNHFRFQALPTVADSSWW